jgi:hypothetical protein
LHPSKPNAIVISKIFHPKPNKKEKVMKSIVLAVLCLTASFTPAIANACSTCAPHKHASMHPFFSALFAVLVVGILGAMFLFISKRKNGNQGK